MTHSGCLKIPTGHLLIDGQGDTNAVDDQTVITILRRLKTLAEASLTRPVKDAVLTVPACYGDRQRHATKKAARSAGWNILRLLSAPMSAAISSRADQRTGADHSLLALNLGASRAEATLLELSDWAFEEKFTISDARLGGRNYDEKLYQHFAIQHQHQQPATLLREACEQAKITLSIAPTAELVNETLTREQFEDVCGDLFTSTVGLIAQVLLAANTDKASVKEVVLAGGLARVPKIQRVVSDFFGMRIGRLIIPNMACVRVAALYAASSSGGKVPYFGDFFLVLGIIPYSVSIELRLGFHLVILPRYTVAPHRSMSLFNVSNDLPRRLCLFDGHLKGKHALRTFDLSLLQVQLGSNQEYELKVEIYIDRDGIMKASLLTTNRSTGVLVIIPGKREPAQSSGCNTMQAQHVQSYLSVVKSLCGSQLPEQQPVLEDAISQAEHWMQVCKQDDNDDGRKVLEQLIR